MGAVVLRLKRLGGKKKPFYRIVAVNKADKRDGKVLEELGHYDPKKRDESIFLKMDRIKHWLMNGALPSATVKSIIKRTGGV
ncbi:MAG: 30S ribosomal protein S16 [Candidatus Omnitrophica bacterium]|nr:30S ribosomal protein S16 [Candidatus Omnitrophota bacterium]MBU1127536.1 30S ribosomal protein S16 [Candidatus Omnitrophota bacterium]MBU1656940.1 30S ribosomal protein S16 [Candidatus Omnitrophota bacterium]MBU1783950.1 30S ribosomal protein S16 [Candidatus Omnitrophota bacterium]MBU1851395.1 30S ribosomal protein S16 [Candidatus Omnitrophota bacterium]